MADRLELGPYDPAEWHDGGVVHPLPVRPKLRLRRLRQVIAEARSASIAFTVSAATMLYCASMPIVESAESLPLGTQISQASTDAGDLQAGSQSDRVDPSKWVKLIAILETLPSSERSDPPDLPPPLI
jgi:hypothetical protein